MWVSFNKSKITKGFNKMPFVVTENCIQCKYGDCVEVCPVDCFYEGPNMLVINPDECIDCALCEPECPVEAIKSSDDLTDSEEQMLDLNLQQHCLLSFLELYVLYKPMTISKEIGVEQHFSCFFL